MLRAEYCCNLIKQAPLGHAAEFGVANGHTLQLAAKCLLGHSPYSKYYGFDWWQGLPAVTNEDGDLKVGEIKSKKSLVEDIVKNNNLTNVVLVDGLIEKTLSQDDIPEFTFAFLDLDLYEPTKLVISYLESNKMPQHGIMGFHDYKFFRTPGITKLVDNLNNKIWTKLFHEGTSIFFRKN